MTRNQKIIDCFMQGCSFDELAIVFGLSLETIEEVIRKALKKVKK